MVWYNRPRFLCFGYADCHCLGYPWNLKESSSLEQLSINQLVVLDLLQKLCAGLQQAQVMYHQVKLGASSKLGASMLS